MSIYLQCTRSVRIPHDRQPRQKCPFHCWETNPNEQQLVYALTGQSLVTSWDSMCLTEGRAMAEAVIGRPVVT